MSENDPTAALFPSAAAPVPALPQTSPNSKPLSWWLRKLFACNPFYLVSAALLLYGCYRVSIDAPLLDRESARLFFNFTLVQGYEILLVLTAIFLSRRHIWYDSTLLVGLENLLVFVPFILISQAALIDSKMAVEMCLGGAAVAVVRIGSLKIKFSQLNLPGRLLGIGTVLLALNVTLPLIYRHFGQTKIGVHIDSGPAFWMNEYTWLIILPAVLGLGNWVPHKTGGKILPQHRWLPLGLFGLWYLVTLVHVYALDYVYQFDLRGELLAPQAWVLAWTVFRRAPTGPLMFKYTLTSLPLLVPLLSNSPEGRKTFLILAALNLAGYIVISLRDRGNRLARHLVIAAGLVFVAGVPENWLPAVAPGQADGSGFVQAEYVGAGMLAYLIFWSVRLRNPKLAIFCAIILGVGILAVFHDYNGAGDWAMQAAFIFLLLHGLRWQDQDHPGANLVRITTALGWVTHSFVWANSEDGSFWMPVIPGGIVLGTCLACRLYRCEWKKSVVPAAALLVILSSPSNAAFTGLRSAPAGLLAVIGSFLLFGFGTLAALTRHQWHGQKPQADTGMPQKESKIP